MRSFLTVSLLNTGMIKRVITHESIQAKATTHFEIQEPGMYLVSIANSYRVGALYILQIGDIAESCVVSTLVLSTYFDVVATSYNTFDIVARNANGFVDISMLGTSQK